MQKLYTILLFETCLKHYVLKTEKTGLLLITAMH